MSAMPQETGHVCHCSARAKVSQVTREREKTAGLTEHECRGEVTHLHCKDRFSAKLAASRE